MAEHSSETDETALEVALRIAGVLGRNYRTMQPERVDPLNQASPQGDESEQLRLAGISDSGDGDDEIEDDQEEASGDRTEQSQAIPTGRDYDAIPPMGDKEKPCPYLRHFESEESIAEFRRSHHVPYDVRLELVRGNRITFGPDFITVPLMALTEGGLTFPIHRVLREFFFRFNLTPVQVTTNVYRTIISIIIMAEGMNFEDLCIGDIMETYSVGKNSIWGRYFIGCRPSKNPLLQKLSDSEKFAKYYVIVRGNFEFPWGEDNLFPIPRVRGNPGKCRSSSFAICQ